VAAVTGDDPSYAFLASDPFAPGPWNALAADLGTLRSGPAPRGGFTPDELLQPRGPVADAAPELVFDEAVLEGVERVYQVSLRHADDGETRRFVVRQPADTSGPVHAALPDGPLAQGTWEWSVALDPAVHPEDAPYYKPRPRTFEVVDGAVRARALALAPSGRFTWDVLRRATALLEAGLAQDALAQLDTLPDDAWPEERLAALLLTARAQVALGFGEAFEATHRRAVELAETLRR
jgi:hypothetical protein